MKKLLRWWRYRECSNDQLAELLELMIKAGRRTTHDLGHALSEIPEDSFLNARLRSKYEMWKKLWYPTNGPKNYRAALHHEIADLERQVGRLEKLCRFKGIDPTDPDGVPF